MKFLLPALLLLATPAAAITPEQIASLIVRSPSPTAAEFVGVEVVGTEVVAVSGDGEVFVSGDEGQSWTLKSTISLPDGNIYRAASLTTNGSRTVVIGSGRYAVSDDLATWQTGFTAMKTLSDVAFGNGRYVGVSTSGDIAWSTDGTDWSEATSIPDESSGLSSIAFGNGTFSTAGGRGILVSANGDTWESKLSGVNLFRMSYARDRFLASGLVGLTYSSADGDTWMQDDLDFPSGVRTVSDMVFDGSRYIFCSFSGIAFTSTDFAAFTTLLLPTGYDGNELTTLPGGTTIACGDAGSLATSNGAGWTPRSQRLGTTFLSVAHGAGTFVTADRVSGEILTSTTGASWEVAYETRTNIAVGPVFTGSQFVVIAGVNRVLTSPGGQDWSETEIAFEKFFQGMRHVNGHLFAWGNATLFTSADAATWRKIDLATSFTPTSIAFGSGRYIAAGNSDQIYSSADLISWTPHPSGAATTARFTGVEFIDGRFIAIESSVSGASVSTDGTSWSRIETDLFPDIRNTISDPDLGLTLIGSKGRITSIPDTSQLDARQDISYPAPITALGIASDGQNTVLVGLRGLIMSTESLISPASSNLQLTLNTSGLPILTWIQPTGTSRALETSTDLINWIPENSPIQSSPASPGSENASANVSNNSTSRYFRVRW